MIREFGFLSFNSIRAKFLALVVPLVLLSTIAVFGLFEFDARRDANLELRDKLDKLVADARMPQRVPHQDHRAADVLHRKTCGN